MRGNCVKRCEKCFRKCLNNTYIPYYIRRILTIGFVKLEHSNSESLLKKYLTRELFDYLKYAKTRYNSNLLDCIESGLENFDSIVGVFAADPEAYFLFSPLFDPIIYEYHPDFKEDSLQPTPYWGSLEELPELDPDGEFIVSIKIRCARCLDGYPFNPSLSERQYTEIEEIMSNILSLLRKECDGTYSSLGELPREEMHKLKTQNLIFSNDDKFLKSANVYRYWPKGRGVFYNQDLSFIIWVNEEDHVKVISLEQGGNISRCYNRLIKGMKQIQKEIRFLRSIRLGYLTMSPRNLGTGLKASAYIKLPKLGRQEANLKKIAKKYELQVRPTEKGKPENQNEMFCVSSFKTLGLNEFGVVRTFYNGIQKLIKAENYLMY